ncbi:MAG: hypothetical protein WCB68_08015 [Pyrinomonadaceae bacterium]
MMNRIAVASSTIRVLLLTTLLLCGVTVTPRGRIGSSYEKSRTLAVSPSSAPVAQISGDGLIAFTADDQIYVMNADGSRATCLTCETPGVLNRYPSLSPDGSRLAFISDNVRRNDHALNVINSDGSNLQRLAYSSVGLGEPAWSPDGSKIAYVRGYDTTYGGYANITSCGQEIYVLDLASGSQVNLTQGGGGTDPAWSPDGAYIAFSSSRNGSYDIYTMAADGSGVKRRTEKDWAEAEPAWSPDGKFIAYSTNLVEGGFLCGFMPTPRPGGHVEWMTSIYIMNADGTDQAMLAGTTGGIEPAWSPDGTSLAFVFNNKLGWQIYVTDAEGTSQMELTWDSMQKFSPSWSRTTPVR